MSQAKSTLLPALPYFQHYFGVNIPQKLTKSSTLNPHLPYFWYTLLSICGVLVYLSCVKAAADVIPEPSLLSDMNIHDGGEYSCEIEADLPEPISMVHTVEILGKEIET